MKEPKIRFKGFSGEWEEKALLDEVRLYNGLTYTPSDIRDKGTLVLRSSNVQEDEITLTDNVYVRNDVATSPNVEKGDIIVVVRNGSRSLIGKHARIKEDMPNTVIGAFMAGLRTEKPEFMNALLSTGRFDAEVQKNLGATINQITNSTFCSMRFFLPKESEQLSVGFFFTTLDAQISASTSRLASLKQIKAASLQAMFPQEGETVPKLRFKGFEGEWGSDKIGNFSSTFSGGTPTSGISEYYGGEIPFIRSGEIHEDKTELFLTEKGYNSSSAKIVDRGTLLYALYGATSGDVAISKIKGAINQAILAITPYKSVEKEFLAYFLLCNKETIVGELLQGGQGNLSGSLIKNIIVKYPCIREQRAIASYFTNLDRQITLQSQRLEKLKQIKAACLDKMFV